MKKGKKIRHIFWILFVVFAVMMDFHSSVQFVQVNVLDRIYMSSVSGYWKLNRIPELENTNEDRDHFVEVMGGPYWLDYKKRYLRKNLGMSLDFLDDGIKVIENIHISDTAQINLEIMYNYASHTMTYKGIDLVIRKKGVGSWEHYYDKETITKYLKEYGVSNEDIREYQDYMLYDVVLRTWVKTNGGIYSWEKFKLKKCKRIDETFLYRKPEWAD